MEEIDSMKIEGKERNTQLIHESVDNLKVIDIRKKRNYSKENVDKLLLKSEYNKSDMVNIHTIKPQIQYVEKIVEKVVEKNPEPRKISLHLENVDNIRVVDIKKQPKLYQESVDNLKVQGSKKQESEIVNTKIIEKNIYQENIDNTKVIDKTKKEKIIKEYESNIKVPEIHNEEQINIVEKVVYPKENIIQTEKVDNIKVIDNVHKEEIENLDSYQTFIPTDSYEDYKKYRLKYESYNQYIKRIHTLIETRKHLYSENQTDYDYDYQLYLQHKITYEEYLRRIQLRTKSSQGKSITTMTQISKPRTIITKVIKETSSNLDESLYEDYIEEVSSKPDDAESVDSEFVRKSLKEQRIRKSRISKQSQERKSNNIISHSGQTKTTTIIRKTKPTIIVSNKQKDYSKTKEAVSGVITLKQSIPKKQTNYQIEEFDH